MSKISDVPAPIYPDYCPMKLDRDGNYYSRHVEAMTTENLHRKSDIAEQLAWRDREIDRLRADMAQIVGCLPGVYYMDPPDGGDVSIPEQVRRMAEDAAKHREAAQASPARQGDALDHVLREMEAGAVQMLPDPAPEVIRGWAVRIRAAQVSPVDRGQGLISLLQELRAASARNEMNGLEADSIGLTEAARRCDVRSETLAMVANKLEAALAARQPVGQEPVEMSPEFTDTARAAIAWVLWHHQGGSSPVGQPLRFALGMGQHDRMTDYQIAEAKRFAAWSNATTEDFHRRDPAPAVDLGQLRANIERLRVYSGGYYLRRDAVLALIDSSKAVQP